MVTSKLSCADSPPPLNDDDAAAGELKRLKGYLCLRRLTAFTQEADTKGQSVKSVQVLNDYWCRMRGPHAVNFDLRPTFSPLNSPTGRRVGERETSNGSSVKAEICSAFHFHLKRSRRRRRRTSCRFTRTRPRPGKHQVETSHRYSSLDNGRKIRDRGGGGGCGSLGGAAASLTTFGQQVMPTLFLKLVKRRMRSSRVKRKAVQLTNSKK